MIQSLALTWPRQLDEMQKRILSEFFELSRDVNRSEAVRRGLLLRRMMMSRQRPPLLRRLTLGIVRLGVSL